MGCQKLDSYYIQIIYCNYLHTEERMVMQMEALYLAQGASMSLLNARYEDYIRQGNLGIMYSSLLKVFLSNYSISDSYLYIP